MGTQIVLISATLPQDVLEMTHKFMKHPLRVLIKRDELTLEGIKQFFVAVESEEWKFDTLVICMIHSQSRRPYFFVIHAKRLNGLKIKCNNVILPLVVYTVK